MEQVALVTGGGRGLGRAFAMALGANGMRVAVASRSVDELQQTEAMLGRDGTVAVAIPTDVTDEAAVGSMVAIAEERLGPIDLLVNNAGTAGPFGPTWEADPAAWWKSVEVNLKGSLLCCHAVLKGMVQRGRGRIVNVASGAGTKSYPYMSAYVTGKCAVIRLTEVLADELRPHGVSVFAIQPGTVRTSMAEELLESEAGKQWLPWFQKIFDEGRDVTSRPAEELVLYLASGKADALSGRMFTAPGAPGNLAGETERILKDELNVMRMR